MKFCVVRLGKSSITEIRTILSSTPSSQVPLNIQVRCKQVPIEVDSDTICFIWLGSDNNKGLPTDWEQGLRAIGKITNKVGGPSYNDDWNISIAVNIVFNYSIKQQDLIASSAARFLEFSAIPVIGLNTHSNQTVQLIRTSEPNQNINSFLVSLDKAQAGLGSQIINALPSVDEDYSRYLDLDDLSPENDETPFEEKEENDSSTITHPFDPTKIDIRPQPLTILSILKRIESIPMRIDLNTEFQRKANLWEIEKQSKLIESLLVRIPLPAFYFDGTADRWLIVDGLQRISTLRNFIILKTFKLQGLEYLKDFENYGWDDLPPYLQSRIEETAVTAYIINPGTPEEVKFNIFKRINTGGLVLSPQEIRHALNQGIPATFVKRLAEKREFIAAMGGRVPIDRMEDRDYVNRFIAFYLSYEKYQPDLDTFLNRGMAALKLLSHSELQKIEDAFSKAMAAAHEIFGIHAFRKRTAENDKRKPINKALFESISVLLARLNEKDVQRLVDRKDEVITSFMHLLNDDVIFFKSISSGTGHIFAVEERYRKLSTLFNKLL